MLDPGRHCIGCSLWAQLMFSKFQTMRHYEGNSEEGPLTSAHQYVKHMAYDTIFYITDEVHHTYLWPEEVVLMYIFLTKLVIVEGMVLIIVWTGDPGELRKPSCIHGTATRQESTSSYDTEYHHHWKQSQWEPNFLQKSPKCAYTERVIVSSPLKGTHAA